MGTTPTPQPVKLTISDLLQYAFEVVSDVQAVMDSQKTAEQKRQAVIDIVSVGLAAYLESKGKAADQKALLGQLVTFVDAGLALYATLGL